MNRFDNHVVVITGASSGIGKAIAHEFVKNGAMVVGTGTKYDKLKIVKDEIGANFMPVISDVRDENQIKDLSNLVKDKFHKLDVLVNNAGRLSSSTPEKLTINDFMDEIDVSFKGPAFMIKHFAHLLKMSENPSVINISSVAELFEAPMSALYGSSKAALGKYSRYMVRELPGIRSNIILPGWIFTPMTKQTGLNSEDEDWWQQQVKPLIPCGRMGKAEEVAHLALFLASDKARYINGASITIDGGFSITQAWNIPGPPDEKIDDNTIRFQSK